MKIENNTIICSLDECFFKTMDSPNVSKDEYI